MPAHLFQFPSIYCKLLHDDDDDDDDDDDEEEDEDEDEDEDENEEENAIWYRSVTLIPCSVSLMKSVMLASPVDLDHSIRIPPTMHHRWMMDGGAEGAPRLSDNPKLDRSSTKPHDSKGMPFSDLLRFPVGCAFT